ncbi:hypothetical protein HK405_001105 [Cladochytrium tenue]|nr:hypothetical protein HK405_001105 [Cladochytrium tenue]
MSAVPASPHAEPLPPPHSQRRLRRVVVLGSTGAGKSTLAVALAARLGVTFIELDAIYWQRGGWEPLPEDEFVRQVEAAVAAAEAETDGGGKDGGGGWVIAGNYRATQKVTLPRAQAVVWLDYGLWTVFWRLWWRTWGRWWTQEDLWGTGTRENMWKHFMLWSEDSLFHWLFKTFWRRRRELPGMLARYKQLEVVRLTRPRQADEWLRNV